MGKLLLKIGMVTCFIICIRLTCLERENQLNIFIFLDVLIYDSIKFLIIFVKVFFFIF